MGSHSAREDPLCLQHQPSSLENRIQEDPLDSRPMRAPPRPPPPFAWELTAAIQVWLPGWSL